MMKIRFTVDRWLNTEDRTKAPRFRKGSTHDLPDASAYRWVRRNVAVYVVAEPVVEVKLDRPMMGVSMADHEAWAHGKPKTILEKPDPEPKKAKGKPKKAEPKPRAQTTVKSLSTSPTLPVKGGGKHGGPGWDDD